MASPRRREVEISSAPDHIGGTRKIEPTAPRRVPFPRDSLSSVVRSRVQLALDAEAHLAELVADVFAVGPGPVDGVVVEPGDDVPVTVVDGLAGGAAVVD